MKIKADAEVSTSDPWYDLTEGGYIEPDELCELPEDAARVKDAVAVIRDFLQSCED